MNEQLPTIDTLIGEMTRYLAAVDLFRAEHCEPVWRSELARPPVEVERVHVAATPVSRAH